MVYVLAAYSLTISVLLIYGVLLQHRARSARIRVDLARIGGQGAPQPSELGHGFNLGAALLSPLWAWSHGLRAVGAIWLASFFVLALAQASGLRLSVLLLGSLLVGAALFLGSVGNRIAATRAQGADAEGLLARELRWAVTGAVLYTAVLPWVCYFWIASA